jgi:hypothetical protein
MWRSTERASLEKKPSTSNVTRNITRNNVAMWSDHVRHVVVLDFGTEDYTLVKGQSSLHACAVGRRRGAVPFHEPYCECNPLVAATTVS